MEVGQRDAASAASPLLHAAAYCRRLGACEKRWDVEGIEVPHVLCALARLLGAQSAVAPPSVDELCMVRLTRPR